MQILLFFSVLIVTSSLINNTSYGLNRSSRKKAAVQTPIRPKELRSIGTQTELGQNITSSANRTNTPSPQEPFYRTGQDGNTPLHLAAIEGNNAFISKTAQKGAIVDFVNFAGETPLYCALKKGHFSSVALLISRGAEINKRLGFGYTLLLFAINNRDSITAQTIIGFSSTDLSAQTFICKLSALHLAIAYNLDDVVDALIYNKAPLNLPDHKGQTPIYTAIFRGKTDIALRLARAGASLTVKDEAGFTPETFARANRHYPLAQLLSEALIEQRKEKGSE